MECTQGSGIASCGVGVDVQPIQGSSHSIITVAGAVARCPLTASVNTFEVLEGMEPIDELDIEEEVRCAGDGGVWAVVTAGKIVGARAAGLAVAPAKERRNQQKRSRRKGNEDDSSEEGCGRMSAAAWRTKKLAAAVREKVVASRFLSQNVDGITGAKLSELMHVDPRVNVVMLQETKEFGMAHLDVWPEWHLFWEPAEVGPHGGASGGVAIAVRKESGLVPYELLPTPFGGNMLAVRKGVKGSHGVVFASFYRQVAETSREAVMAWVDDIVMWAADQARRGDVVVMAGDANLDFLNSHVAVTNGVKEEIMSKLELAGLMIVSREGPFRKVNTRVPHSVGQAGGPAQLDWVIAHVKAFNLYRARVLKVQRLRLPVESADGTDEERWLSDHSAVIGMVDVSEPLRAPKMPIVHAWNTREILESEDMQEQYRQQVMNHQEMADVKADMAGLREGSPREDLSGVVKRLQDIHLEVAEKVVGKVVVKRGAKPWWHSEVDAAYKFKQKAHAAWKCALEGGRRVTIWEMERKYKAQRTYFRKVQAKKKRKAMEKLAADVKKDRTGSTAKRVHLAFNKMTAPSMGEQGMGASATVEFPMGGMSEAAEGVDQVGELVSRFTEVNSGYHPEDPQFDKTFLAKVGGAVGHIREMTPEQQGAADWCQTDISKAEVAKAVDKLRKKLHKSCGIDGIENWMIVYGAEIGVWTLVFSTCWGMREMPEQWDTARVKYLYKGTGSRFEITNYRPISLISCVAKLFAMVWLERMQKVADRYLVVQQGCGRRKHGATDQALYFKRLVKEAIKNVGDDGVGGAKVYACFTDAAKAYDRVWRDGLYLALFFYGIRGTMLKMVMLWLDRACAETVWNGTKGPVVRLRQGVRQGCPMSPLFYEMFLNVFVGIIPEEEVPAHLVDLRREFFGQGMMKLESEWEGLGCGRFSAGVFDDKLGVWVSNLLFMDDTVLLGATPAQVQVLLDAYVAFCVAFRIYLNTKKTKVLVFSKDGDQGELQSWQTALGKVSMVEAKGDQARTPSYKYLGVVFDPALSMTGHVARAAGKAKAFCPKVRVIAEIMGERMALLFLDKVVAPSVLWGAVALDTAARAKVAALQTPLVAEAVRVGHLWQRMPKPKAAEVLWMADTAPWQVVVERDILSAKRAIRTGRTVCLAHQREAVEAAAGGSLVECGKEAGDWRLSEHAFRQNKREWKCGLKPRFLARVGKVKRDAVAVSVHDAKYGRGSAAVAAGVRGPLPGKEVGYWGRVLPVPAARQAMLRFKLGMIPGIKAKKSDGQTCNF